MSAQVNSPAPEGYRTRAQRMYADHNYIGCIDQMQYAKQESTDPVITEQADYYIALSAAHLKRIDAPALLKYFLWKYPTSVKRWEVSLTMAEMALDRHEYAEARRQLQAIPAERLDLSQQRRRTYALAVAMIKTGDLDRAERMLATLASDKRYGADARFYQGYIAYSRGDYGKAKQLLTGLDTTRQPASMADWYLAQIAFAERDFSRAASLATRLSGNTAVDAPYRSEALRIAGEANYNLGNDSKAISQLTDYLASTDTPMHSALYIVGTDAYRRADYAKAIELLGKVADDDNAMAQSALLTIGEALMAQGNNSSAMLALDRAYSMDHDQEIKETALYNYAVARTEGGRIPFGSTVATFEDFLRQFPRSPHAPRIREYLVKGYITDNNLPAALASINAIDNPSDEILAAKQLVLYTLGSRQTAAGNYSQAVATLSEAKRLASHNPQVAAETDLWLGDAYYGLQDWAKAQSAYQGALKSKHLTDDNRPLATYNLGYAYFSAPDYPQATAQFKKFVTAPGQSPARMVADAYNRLGDAQFVDSKFADASANYAKALQLSPETGDYPLYQQAIAKGLQSDYNGKLADLATLMRRFPESPLMAQALLETGLTYDQMRNTDRTIETYSQLVARYGSTQQSRQAQLLMALTYINSGDTPQAIDTYKNLITAAPTSDEARQAADLLKNLLADNGRIGEYSDFMTSVPGAAQVDANDLEATAFAAAERQYLTNGTSSRLIDYIERFPNGSNMAKALSYAMKANATAGNTRMAMTMASRLIEEYGDSPYTPDALITMADAQIKQGDGEAALATYRTLRDKASTPQQTNTALLGIMHTALDLQHYEQVIEAADAMLGSSTPTADQTGEAALTRGLALMKLGRHDEAETQWDAIAGNLDDINGTKAAYYIAQQQFDMGQTDKAQKSIEALVDSDTPHIYWLARGFILLSDIHRAKGNDFEANQYLESLRRNYPGTESDIINLIDQRLK